MSWFFDVTINDISVICVTAHIFAGGLKKLDLRSGSKRNRHFIGFVNVPVQTPTRDHNFYTEIPTHHPYKSPFTTRWVRLGYCFTPYQRLMLYNGAPFSRLLHAGDPEETFST